MPRGSRAPAAASAPSDRRGLVQAAQHHPGHAQRALHLRPPARSRHRLDSRRCRRSARPPASSCPEAAWMPHRGGAFGKSGERVNGTSPASPAARGRRSDGRRPPARRMWRVDEERHAHEPGGYHHRGRWVASSILGPRRHRREPCDVHGVPRHGTPTVVLISGAGGAANDWSRRLDRGKPGCDRVLLTWRSPPASAPTTGPGRSRPPRRTREEPLGARAATHLAVRRCPP